ncbi:hypothetical protein QR685DRAFT_542599 [Neurospora intermedia]|uniref:Uncharacterized protein n=1 Tax=Neurospora intermedia TaxID=5142 RepID=A0ABR3DQJ9_NEUIN
MDYFLINILPAPITRGIARSMEHLNCLWPDGAYYALVALVFGLNWAVVRPEGLAWPFVHKLIKKLAGHARNSGWRSLGGTKTGCPQLSPPSGRHRRGGGDGPCEAVDPLEAVGVLPGASDAATLENGRQNYRFRLHQHDFYFSDGLGVCFFSLPSSPSPSPAMILAMMSVRVLLEVVEAGGDFEGKDVGGEQVVVADKVCPVPISVSLTSALAMNISDNHELEVKFPPPPRRHMDTSSSSAGSEGLHPFRRPLGGWSSSLSRLGSLRPVPGLRPSELRLARVRRL